MMPGIFNDAFSGDPQQARLSILPLIILAALLFYQPAWGQPESDYLSAMDTASGQKKKPASEENNVVDEGATLVKNASSIEMESLLSQGYPEEFALYQKLPISSKNEVISSFQATEGDAENIRMMKLVNKIGLIGEEGGWDF